MGWWEDPEYRMHMAINKNRQRAGGRPEPSVSRHDFRQVRRKRPPPLKIDFSPTHPLVIDALKGFQEILSQFNPIGDPRIDPGRNRLDIRVSRAGVETALYILEEFLRFLEANQLSATVTKVVQTWDDQHTQIIGLSQPVAFYLIETTVRVNQPQKSQFDPKYVLRPTGLFRFVLDDYAIGVRRDWKLDLKRELKAQFTQILDAARTISKTRTQQKIQWQKESERRAEQERAAARLSARLSRLKSGSLRWKDTQTILEFVSAIERRANDTGKLTPRLQEWLEWARRSFDPGTIVDGFVLKQDESNDDK